MRRSAGSIADAGGCFGGIGHWAPKDSAYIRVESSLFEVVEWTCPPKKIRPGLPQTSQNFTSMWGPCSVVCVGLGSLTPSYA